MNYRIRMLEMFEKGKNYEMPRKEMRMNIKIGHLNNFQGKRGFAYTGLTSPAPNVGSRLSAIMRTLIIEIG